MPAPPAPANARPMLVVMRRANMTLAHPKMIISECDRCHEPVGIYPSGQRVLAAVHPEVVCEICHGPVTRAMLAPGALAEKHESKPAPPVVILDPE